MDFNKLRKKPVQKESIDIDSLIESVLAEEKAKVPVAEVQEQPKVVQEQPKEAEQPREGGFWNTYLGDMIEKFGAGVTNMEQNALGLYGKASNLLNSKKELPIGTVGNVAKSVLGLVPGGRVFSEIVSNTGGLAKKAEAGVSNVTDNLRQKSDRYNGKNFVELWEDDKAAAVGDVFLQASESLPRSLMIAFGGPAAVASSWAMTANEKYDTLDENNPDMTEKQKILNSLLTATAESGSEYLGSVPVGKWLKGMYSKAGKDVAEQYVKKGIASWIGGNAKKLGVFFPPVAEGTEEIASQVAENITDWATGARPDLNPMEGAFESFVYGAGGGAQFSAMSLPAYGAKLANKAKTGYEFRKATKEFSNLFEDESVDDVVAGLSSMTPEEQKQWLSAIRLSDYTDDQKVAATNLLTTTLERNAARSPEEYASMREESERMLIDSEMKRFEAASKPYISDNGRYQQVKLGGDDVFIITGGTVGYKQNEFGEYVLDLDSTSEELYYVDGEGNTQITTGKAITEIVEIADYEQEYNEYLQHVTNAVKQRNQLQESISQEVTIENGDPVQYMGPDGNLIDGIAADTSLPEVITLEDGTVVPRENVIPNTQGAAINPPADLQTEQPTAQTGLQTEQPVQPVQDGTQVVEQQTPVFPVDKNNNIDYSQISEPEMYAQALQSEFENEAVDVIDEQIQSAQARLDKASKNTDAIARRRAMKVEQAEVERLNKVKEILTPVQQNVSETALETAGNVNPLQAEQNIMSEEELSMLTEPERRLHVAENSNDPLELADLYEQVKDETEYSEMLPWQAALLGRRVNKDSFVEHSDKNNITGAIAKSWFADKESGKKAGLDVIAAELSEYGIPVTENDIVKFILEHPGNSVKKRSKVSMTAERRFKQLIKDLTGENVGGLESNSGRLVLAGLRAGVRAEQEKQALPYDMFTIPDSIVNFFEETGLNPDDFNSFEELNDAVQRELESGTFVFPLGPTDLQTINNIVQHGIKQQANYTDFASRVEKAGTQRATQQPIFETAAGQRLEPITIESGTESTEPESGTNEQITEQEEIEYTPEEMAEIDAAIETRPLIEVIQEAAVVNEINEAEKDVDVEPTEAQKEAGNYKKGHIKLNGFDITIENPKGSQRSGIDADGKKWSIEMANSYGYIKGTKGKDNDQVDIFLGDSPLSDKVFVVDQVNKDGSFDEHKCMIGFNTIEEAESAYLSNYEKGWTGLGSITEMPVDEFREWVKEGKKVEPAANLGGQSGFISSLKSKYPNGVKLYHRTTNDGLELIKKDGYIDASDSENGVHTVLGDKSIKRVSGNVLLEINVPVSMYDKLYPEEKTYYTYEQDGGDYTDRMFDTYMSMHPNIDGGDIVFDGRVPFDIVSVLEEPSQQTKTALEIAKEEAKKLDKKKTEPKAEDIPSEFNAEDWEGREIYHGSPDGKITTIDPYMNTKGWKEGLGFYTTENKAKASDYAGGRTASSSRKGNKGSVMKMKFPEGVKIMDMDAPADGDFWKDVYSKMGFDEPSILGTNMDMYHDAIISWEDEFGSAEGQYVVEEYISSKFDATTHMEGKNSIPHRVFVWKSEDLLPDIIEDIQANEELVEDEFFTEDESKYMDEAYSISKEFGDFSEEESKQVYDIVKSKVKDRGLKSGAAIQINNKQKVLSRAKDVVRDRARIESDGAKASAYYEYKNQIKSYKEGVEKTGLSISEADAIYLQAIKEVKSAPVEPLEDVPEETDMPEVEAKKEKLSTESLPSTAKKIEDFGEKIGGAKKDLIKEYRDRMERVTEDNVLELPLSKSFPRPDFKRLVEEGVITENQAIYMSFLYDKIKTKPRDKYKSGRWASRVKEVIDLFNEIIDGKSSHNLMDEAISKVNTDIPTIKLDMEAYRDVMVRMGFPKNAVSLGKYEVKQMWNKSSYYITKGNIIVKKADTYDEILDMFVELLGKPKAKKEVKLDVYKSRKTGNYFIGKGIQGKEPITLSKEFESKKEVFDYLKNNRDELVKLWEKISVNPEERRESNRKRKGIDWRESKNVTPEQFGSTFGFRGVEFGNWVNKSERQEALNDAYDALMDLSSIVGLSPRALSLGGKLGLAFGARGGSKASAHYEPGKVVINLTKTKGAGSLAHEWFHALDNYFSRMRGNSDGFLTKDTSRKHDDNTRQELLNSFKDLMDSITKSDISKRSKKLDSTRSKAYWAEDVEMAARAFESYVIDKLNSRDEHNDYLANVKDMNEWDGEGESGIESYPYPNEVEAPIIGEKFDQLFQTIEETEDEHGNQILFSDETSETDQIKTGSVNEQFNNELQMQIDDVLPKGHIYKLGMPSDVLLSAGIPNLPIEMNSDKLSDKSKQNNHPFDLSKVMNLPDAIHSPIAVFDSKTQPGSKVILTEITSGEKNFVVAIRAQKHKTSGRRTLLVNEIRSLYPKDTQQIAKWIESGELMRWVDKEKAINWLGKQQFNSADVAIPYDSSTAANIVNSFDNPTLDNGNILSEIELLSSSLNTPVRVVRDISEIKDSDKDLEKRMLRSRGWYDTTTGEVVIVLANNKTVAEAQSTVLHEVVGHMGLRKLLGSDFNQTMSSIYDSLPKDVQKSLMDKYGSKLVAAEEYASEMAETLSDPGIVQRIASAFKQAMRKLGINLKMTDGDIMTLLWKSKNRLTDGDSAADIVRKMGKEDKVKSEARVFDRVFRDGTLAEAIEEISDDPIIKQRMHAAVKSRSFQLQEGYQDRMLAVKKMQQLLEEQKGTKLPDYMNVYMFENTLSSRNTYEIEQYNENYYKPMMESITAIIKNGDTLRDVEDYAIAKHGIERNDLFRLNALKEEIDNLAKNNAYLEWLPDDVRSDSKKFQDRVEGDKQMLLEEIGEGKFSDIEGLSIEPFESLRKKLGKKDYAGLTALEAEYDAPASEIVKSFESRNEKYIDGLWKSINKATKASLKKWFDSGMITKDTFNKINGMYSHYVPLRGFAEETASDVYEYFTEQESAFNSPLRKADGRKSKPETPFAHILSMAGSSIVGGNKNIMKLHLLRLAQAHPSDYMTADKTWYVDNGKVDTETGKPMYDPVFPEYSEDINTYRENVEQFEMEMNELREQGIAFKGVKKLKPGYKISKIESSEHMVRAVLNGEEYHILVHGDPRVAQAVNGINDKGRQESAFMKKIAWANRQMAANFTTRNPAFIASNLVRDVIFASTALSIKEGSSYTMKFEKNIFGGAGGALMRFLQGKPDMSKQEDVYLKEFLENGGETGHTALYNIDKYKKMVEKDARQGKKADARKKYMSVIDFFANGARWAEDLSRFSVYMASRQSGRSVLRSVSDAKEVTVNFNRKGSGSYGAGYARAAYLFFNAAVQSLSNAAVLMKNNPVKGTAALMSYASVGLLIPAIIASLGDDDDLERYNKLPDYVRKNHLCIPVGEMFVKIPLPIELRAFYGLGDQMYRTLSGLDGMGESLTNIALSFMDLLPLNPSGGGDVLGNIFPDATVPFYESYYSNKDFTGKPIAEITPFNEFDPEYKRVYKSANAVPVYVSQFLNSVTGGDEVKRGVYDKALGRFANPASFEHLFGSYFGGLWTTLNHVYKSTENVIKAAVQEDFDAGENQVWRTAPILNRFVDEGKFNGSLGKINERYFDAVREMRETKHLIKGYEDKLGEQLTASEAAKIAAKISDIMKGDQAKRMYIIEDYSKEIQSLSKESENASRDRKMQVNDRINELKERMLEKLKEY